MFRYVPVTGHAETAEATFSENGIYIYVRYRALQNATFAPISLPTYCSPISMTNFNNPLVIYQDYRACTFLTISLRTGEPTESFNSCCRQAVAHCRRSLHVSLSGITDLVFMPNSIPTFSWEWFTTLDYEWKVFRGQIPYRPTIWVRKYMRIALLSSAISMYPTDSFPQ